MKFFILLMLATQAYGASLSKDWTNENLAGQKSYETLVEKDFSNLLEAQAEILDEMENANEKKSLPFGFKMNAMITDLAISKSGLIGFSALKANNGVEIKWQRKKKELIEQSEKGVDLILDEEATPADVTKLSSVIAKMAMNSGKVSHSGKLENEINRALTDIQQQLSQIHVTQYGDWEASGLRFDLNFSASGQVWYFTKLGAAFRVRMEWKLKRKKLFDAKMASVNGPTKFVVKAMAELNEGLKKFEVMGFTPKKISLGVGGSYKGSLFGIWKYSTGFVGYLAFSPVKNKNKIDEPILPQELLNEDFYMGGFEEDEKLVFFRRALKRESFSRGLQKSLNTAAFFAENALKQKSRHWQVSEVKTINDISKTGFFGVSNLTAKGVVEIDFKRK